MFKSTIQSMVKSKRFRETDLSPWRSALDKFTNRSPAHYRPYQTVRIIIWVEAEKPTKIFDYIEDASTN